MLVYKSVSKETKFQPGNHEIAALLLNQPTIKPTGTKHYHSKTKYLVQRRCI